ncbi:hypothetical protein D4R89_02930 [bacterium]|nr:MAG: hypothetical protein D4R89_02930 [bacterium]
MIATTTLKTIVMVLFGLTIVWLVKILIKQEFETLVRALIVAVLFGGAFFFLQKTKLETISWKDIKQMVFPEKAMALGYVKDEGRTGGGRYVRYTFPAPTGEEGSLFGIGPRLKLTMDPNGRNYNITDIEPVNRVLTYVGLPKVKAGIKELSAITGRLSDVNHYRWDDYEGGVLTIERGLCQNKDSLERYPCIVSITVQTGS